MTKTSTHYDRLGVARNAPDEVIRGAYKALAQKNHPDKNINNPAATALMQEINQAYAVLSDPGKKADYDARLDLEERRSAPRAEEWKPRPSSSGNAGRGAFAQQPRAERSGGSGGVFLIVTLLAGICVAFFLYFSASEPVSPDTLLRAAVGESIPARPAAIPRPVETFVPHETTPHELAVCVFAAAKTYAVPPALLLGLLSAEGGAVGEKTPAAGSEDLGLMQINSAWVPQLAKAWEVSPATALRRVRDDACVGIGIGAWILQTSLVKGGDLSAVIALYHASAHHSEPNAADAAYVQKTIKLMELYKSVHSPEDLLGQSAASANK